MERELTNQSVRKSRLRLLRLPQYFLCDERLDGRAGGGAGRHCTQRRGPVALRRGFPRGSGTPRNPGASPGGATTDLETGNEAWYGGGHE
jgi:hypothetical protein